MLDLPVTVSETPRNLAIEWDVIDTVFLDMDGTLLDLNFDNHFWKQHMPMRYAEANHLSFEQACAKLYPHMLEIRGTLNWYSVHYWSDYVGFDVLALNQEVAELIRPRPGVLDFLQMLANNNHRVVLATNAHHDTIDLKFGCAGIAQFFDQCISSHELGASKENPQFWHALEKRLDFDKTRTLFIDDNESVLQSAKNYGISHLLTIAQPDLMQPPQAPNGFVAIDHFDQINPTRPLNQKRPDL